MPGNSYFEERAEEELVLAQRAKHPNAVKAHYELAGFYLDRVYGPPAEEAADGQISGRSN